MRVAVDMDSGTAIDPVRVFMFVLVLQQQLMGTLDERRGDEVLDERGEVLLFHVELEMERAQARGFDGAKERDEVVRVEVVQLDLLQAREEDRVRSRGYRGPRRENVVGSRRIRTPPLDAVWGEHA